MGWLLTLLSSLGTAWSAGLAYTVVRADDPSAPLVVGVTAFSFCLTLRVMTLERGA